MQRRPDPRRRLIVPHPVHAAIRIDLVPARHNNVQPHKQEPCENLRAQGGNGLRSRRDDRRRLGIPARSNATPKPTSSSSEMKNR